MSVRLNRDPRPAPGANRQVLVALVGASLVAALLLFTVLSTSSPRRAGTNGRLLALPVNLKPGGRFCQSDEVLPKGAAGLGLTVNTGPSNRQGGPLRAEIRLRGAAAPITGGVPGGYTTQVVTIPLVQPAPPKEDIYRAEVCVENMGTVPVAMFGDRVLPGEKGANIRGGSRDVPARARMDWYRQGKESWFALAPVVSERFALFKASFFGDWTLWVLAALGACTLLGTGAFLIRDLRL